MALYLWRSSLSSWMAFSSSLKISRLLFFFVCSFFLPGRSGRDSSALLASAAASSRAFFRLLKDSASSASLLVGLYSWPLPLVSSFRFPERNFEFKTSVADQDPVGSGIVFLYPELLFQIQQKMKEQIK